MTVEPWFVLLLVAISPFALLGISYNRFVVQVASTNATWANIDTQLQRRHDLIPNLVRTVAGYAAHERDTFEAVTAARTRAIAAIPTDVSVDQQARAEDALTQGLTSLLAVTEGYPPLKSDRNFRDLQRQLVETEDRIAASRRLYNLEVAAYERRRRSLPSNLVANAFGFDERRLFEIQDAAAAHAVEVGF